MHSPKVVFFTQAYNAQELLPRTLDCVLGQTYDNLQYYVLDNGSEDDTEELLYSRGKDDERLVPLRLNQNDIANGGAFFTTLIYASDAQYIVWLDADDTYEPDFLERMVPFAEEYQLDIAACGYNMIDGATDELLKRRVPDEKLIIEGDAFTDDFIKYRGFATSVWGKLYSIPFFRRRAEIDGTSLSGFGRTPKKYQAYMDVWGVLWNFRKAKRIGLYPAALHNYYQYPHSASRTNLEQDIRCYQGNWNAIKKYLDSYGPISALNMDYLYAIHMSLLDEQIRLIMESDMSTQKKLEGIRIVFEDPIWPETLARKADPQFRNLAARGEYCEKMKRLVSSLPGAEDYPELLKSIHSHLIYKGE